MLTVKNKIFLLIALYCFLATNLCAAKPFIIDTDASIDAAIAILYLANNADINLKAITITSTGEAHCAAAFKNTVGLLQLSPQKNIPIACGRSNPLVGTHHFPNFVRLSADTLLDTAELLPQTNRSNNQSALSLLKSTLQNSADKSIDILVIGPLTNLGELFSKYPALKNKVRQIYIMGGALIVPGNLSELVKNTKNVSAEWNIYVDPVAANIVFRSGVPIILVPLDLTNQVPMDHDFFQKLQQQHSTPAANYVYQLFKRNEKNLLDGWYFWDPLAAVIASDHAIVTMQKEKIRVVLAKNNQYGATRVDNLHGAMLSVGVVVDKAQFNKLLIDGL